MISFFDVILINNLPIDSLSYPNNRCTLEKILTIFVLIITCTTDLFEEGESFLQTIVCIEMRKRRQTDDETCVCFDMKVGYRFHPSIRQQS